MRRGVCLGRVGMGLIVFCCFFASWVEGRCMERVAVLELRSSAGGLSAADRDYLVDSVVRGAVRKALPAERYLVMTKETMIELLAEQRIDFEKVCEGSCELEVGRKIGAHYIVKGSCWRVGNRHQVAIKLYDTRSGNLLSQETVSGADAEGLSGPLAMATRSILVGLISVSSGGGSLSGGSGSVGGASSGGSESPWSEARSGAVVAGSGATEGMVLIPGGTYWMGCVTGDGECFGDEKPRHQVTVSSFWMDRYEVTQSEFERVMGKIPVSFPAVGIVLWNRLPG